MRSSLPPGPRSGALQSLRYPREPFGYYEEMRRRYGTLFTLPSLNGTLVGTARLLVFYGVLFAAGIGVAVPP